MIIIDPGHGGPEPNSFRMSPPLSSEGYQIREADINLRVAVQVAEILLSAGVAVALTRTEDVVVSLEDRVQMARKLNARLLLSIHHNSFDPANEWSDFPIVYVSNPQMFELAHRLLDAFETERGIPGGVLDSKPLYQGQGLYLMREFPNTVLTEYAFFSRPQTARRMEDWEWCQTQALAIAEAILQS